MREKGERLATIYVLEDRKLPDGEWATTEDGYYFESIDGAEDQAQEWREMRYDDDEKYDLRVVAYERKGPINPDKAG